MIDQLAVAFLGGLAATLTPCVLPLYPGFLAYLATRPGLDRSRGVRWLGLLVLAGVLTAMLVLGALIAALQVATGDVLRLITPAADLFVIGLGVALLLGRNPFARLPTLSVGHSRGSPALSAYVYGLLYGPIALPCAAPLVIGIFLVSFGVADLAGKLAFFLVFGLGFGVPLFALSLLAEGRRSALLRAFTQHYAVISRMAGIALVAVGLWDLSVNLSFARLYLTS
ncbi:MAG: cytochrome c biogenesis CcdA family protein [Candidatus Limnocylindria bacterium]